MKKLRQLQKSLQALDLWVDRIWVAASRPYTTTTHWPISVCSLGLFWLGQKTCTTYHQGCLNVCFDDHLTVHNRICGMPIYNQWCCETRCQAQVDIDLITTLLETSRSRLFFFLEKEVRILITNNNPKCGPMWSTPLCRDFGKKNLKKISVFEELKQCLSYWRGDKPIVTMSISKDHFGYFLQYTGESHRLFR